MEREDYEMLQRIEDVLEPLGNANKVLPMLVFIFGKYVSIGMPDKTAEQAWEESAEHFKTLFISGFKMWRGTGPS